MAMTRPSSSLLSFIRHFAQPPFPSLNALAPYPSHPKPWHILQRDTWHPSKDPSQEDMRMAASQTLLPWCKLWQSPPLHHGSMPMPSVLPPEESKEVGRLPKLMFSPGHSMPTPPKAPSHENNQATDALALSKTRRLLQLLQLDTLKQRLEMIKQEVMSYDDFLKLCMTMGVASSQQDATQLVTSLDRSSVILILHNKVYLKPRKVAKLVNDIIPSHFSVSKHRQDTDQELSKLQSENEVIEKLANKHARRVLWSGFGYLTLQMALILRLTFWELSWDVMEPIAYLVTNVNLLVGYAFYMTTSKHPTYRDLFSVLVSSKQKKLMKKRNFNLDRLLELQKQAGELASSSSTLNCQP